MRFSILWGMCIVVFLISNLMFRINKDFYIRGPFHELLVAFGNNMLIFVGVTVILYFLKRSESSSRGVMVLFIIIDTLLITLIHQIIKALLPGMYQRMMDKTRMLLVTDRELAESSVDDVRGFADFSQELIGITILDDADRKEFKGLPVDGSSKMPNNLMESLEPFDLSEAVDFQTAYLSGYLTDRYDVTAEECIPRVNERVKQTTFDTIASTVQGYQTVSYQGGDVRTEQGQIKYAMYPVWILNTTFGKEHYLFAMNGQTGKMVGDLPIDNGKVWKYRLLWTGILGVIFSIAAVIFRFFV